MLLLLELLEGLRCHRLALMMLLDLGLELDLLGRAPVDLLSEIDGLALRCDHEAALRGHLLLMRAHLQLDLLLLGGDLLRLLGFLLSQLLALRHLLLEVEEPKQLELAPRLLEPLLERRVLHRLLLLLRDVGALLDEQLLLLERVARLVLGLGLLALEALVLVLVLGRARDLLEQLSQLLRRLGRELGHVPLEDEEARV